MVKLTAIPNDQLVLPNGLINIESFESIDNIQVVSSLSANSVCKILVTTDLKSYYTYDFVNEKWIEVDKTSIDIKGIPVQDLSNIDWSELIKGKSGIGVAYLLKIENSKDICAIDNIKLTVDMRGEWNKAIYNSEYKYGYITNKVLKLSLLSNGDYKINYSEGAKNP